MRRFGLAAIVSLGVSGSLASLQACAPGDHRVEHVMPFDGATWPSTRPTYDIPKGALALVTNNASDTLSLLDLDKNVVVASPPIGIDPVANNGPHHAVIDRTSQFVFTPLAFPPSTLPPGPHAAHGSSTVPGVLLKLALHDLSRVGTVTVFENPGDVALTPDGAKVLVSHFDLRRAVEAAKNHRPVEDMRAPLAVVDAATMQIVGQPSPCVAAHGIAIAADGHTAYLACYGEDAIAAVNLDDPSFAAKLWPVGPSAGTPGVVRYGPYFATLTSKGDRLVVSETEGKEVRVLDVASHATVATIATGGAAYGGAASADGASFVVAVQQPDALVTFDSATFGKTQTRRFAPGECEKPHQVVRKGARWFVVCEGDHVAASHVLEIAPATLSTIRTFDVGAYPDILVFSPENP